MDTEELHDKDYLGDGVYVGHDGYQIVLWLEDQGAYGIKAIALEPSVFRNLASYAKRVGANSFNN